MKSLHSILRFREVDVAEDVLPPQPDMTTAASTANIANRVDMILPAIELRFRPSGKRDVV
jgi:hypothetical protein